MRNFVGAASFFCLLFLTMTSLPGRDAAETSQQVETLLKQFTLEEKIDYIGGFHGASITPIPHLGLPEIKMCDGPMGIRDGGMWQKPSTCYGAGIGLAATWDPELASRMGASLARDARARGIHILLAPGMNISRSPLCGRNFEYLGEDPYLAGKIAVGYLQGLRSQGVLGCIKHFDANNQEWDRNGISSEVDERTLREIYLPAFETAVKEGSASVVMAAYNLLNGIYCTQNDWLLNQTLKKEWKFSGMVMSDWCSVHDTVGATLGGCDMEMPAGSHLNRERLISLVRAGTISESVIDDKVRRILTTIIGAGFLDRPQLRPEIPLEDPTSEAIALEGAKAGTVLLKNDHHLLPLKLDQNQTILVVGPNADPAVTGGFGSSHVTPFRSVSVLDGIRAAAPKATILYHPGLQSPLAKSTPGSLINFALPPGTYLGEDTLAKMAVRADIIIACVGFGQSRDTNSSHLPFVPFWPFAKPRQLGLVEAEDSDRPFAFTAPQVETLKRVAALHKKLVVILNSGAAVDPAGWLDQVPALICAWYPGQEGGTALAGIIDGSVNPSGKLPVTFARRYEDYPCAPYYQIKDHGKTPYTEGLNVGYRGFDAAKIEPLFCFGYGLSYTSFSYANLKIEPADQDQVRVSFTVQNTGQQAGAEVAQLYVTPAAAPVSRPPQELKGFAKLELLPGEIRSAEILLNARSFSYWSVDKHDWTIAPGNYGILIGASSRDIRLHGTIDR